LAGLSSFPGKQKAGGTFNGYRGVNLWKVCQVLADSELGEKNRQSSGAKILVHKAREQKLYAGRDRECESGQPLGSKAHLENERRKRKALFHGSLR